MYNLDCVQSPVVICHYLENTHYHGRPHVCLLPASPLISREGESAYQSSPHRVSLLQAKLYPEFTVAHMPSAEMQSTSALPRSPADGAPVSFESPIQTDQRSRQPTQHPKNATTAGGKGCGGEAGKKGAVRTSEPGGEGSVSEEAYVESAAEGCSPQEGSAGGVPGGEGADSRGVVETGTEGAGVDCCSLLANAPVFGDHYDYHVDCDPLVLPDCAWRREFGDFCNR